MLYGMLCKSRGNLQKIGALFSTACTHKHACAYTHTCTHTHTHTHTHTCMHAHTHYYTHTHTPCTPTVHTVYYTFIIFLSAEEVIYEEEGGNKHKMYCKAVCRILSYLTLFIVFGFVSESSIIELVCWLFYKRLLKPIALAGIQK